ncbi:MAG: peptidyl-prolyl cis-trans isomerase [Oscillospiraceae bacterium]|jgi:hypothetical protein|nr:peptidyl-prolyl cis-trans isomerase [Oscillospiraceae bacterium]
MAKDKHISTDGFSRRDARQHQEQLDRKKTTKTATIIAAVLVVLFVAALFVNSNYIRRGTTAYSAGELELSPVEYNFFYFSAFYEYQAYVYENLSSFSDSSALASLLPDNSKPWASQVKDQVTGQTWAQYFAEDAAVKIADAAKIIAAAKAEGFTLNAEQRAELDTEIEGLRESAKTTDSKNFKTFLNDRYDPYKRGMTEKIYTQLFETLFTCDAYAEAHRDALTYTSEELAAYYNENKDALDTITFRSIRFAVETPAREIAAEEEGGEPTVLTDEEYEAAVSAAIEAAHTMAEELQERVTSEEDFINEALAYSPIDYPDADATIVSTSGENLGEKEYSLWLRDQSRKAGDMAIFSLDSDTTTAWYLMYYVERDANDYNTVGMRQILIQPTAVDANDLKYVNGDDTKDTDAYDADVAAADAEAKAKADALYKQWKDGGATEDAFIALIPDNSVDTTEGGLYEHIYKQQMIAVINDWLFAAGRKTGDSEVIKSDEFGYHIVYFTGVGELYSDYISEGRLRAEDYTEWREGIQAPAVEKHWAERFV